MKNMIRHQISAMPIQMTSSRPTGTFHQTRSAGGKNEVMAGSSSLGFFYGATGMVTSSMMPQIM